MHRLAPLLAFGLLVAPALSQEPHRPDFSGTWTMNAAKTRLQISRPESTVLRIEQRGPSFVLTRTHVAKGKPDTFTIALTIDGEETVLEEPGQKSYHRVRWEGERLVFESRVVRGGKESTNRVEYALSADGKVLTAQEEFRGPVMEYDNVWVFDRE